MLKKLIILTFITLLGLFPATAAKLTVSQQGPGTYSVGQTFVIEIRLDNPGNRDRLPNGFNVPGCAMISQSLSSMSSVVSDSKGHPVLKEVKTVNLVVSAAQPGNYSFNAAAGPLKSNTINYRITGSGQTPPASTSNPYAPAPAMNYTLPDGVHKDDVMILATVSNRNPYTQQGILYTVKLFTRVPLNQFPDLNYPKFENCTYEILPDSGTHELQRESLNGTPYMSVELYSMIVYPSKPGKAKLIGADNTVHLDYFTDIQVKTNDIEIDVKELPDLVSHSDINGVGGYKVKAELLTGRLHAGEVAKVRFTVSGIGNPSFVSMPDLRSVLPDGFEFIRSESAIDKAPTPDGINATITFDCTLLPSKAGDFTLPGVEFTFFEPKTAKWYTRSTGPLQLNVQAGASHEGGDDSLVFDQELQESSGQMEASPFFISSIAYWLIYVSLAVALVAVLSFYRKRLALLADRDALKHRRAGSVARTRLKAAAKAMKAGNTQLFYDEMLKAMWGYLGDKLMMPTSELVRSNISANMQAIGVDPEMTVATIDFIDTCEFAKYATAAGTDMAGVYARAVELIDGLEREINAGVKVAGQADQLPNDK